MGRLSGWLRRKSHTITAGVGASDHYQIPFKVYKGNGTDGTETWGTYTLHKVYCGGNCRDDFGDIRFTDDDGTTLLDYWIDDKNFISGTSAIIWVEVIDDLSSNQSIYIYYDNPSATSVSSIENTFLVPADEFTGNNGDAPNPDKWTSSPSPYATIQDNTLQHYFPNSSHRSCTTEATISPTFPIEICFEWKTTKLQLTLSNVVFCIYNSNPWWSIYYRDYGVYIYTMSGGNWGQRASTGVLAIDTWYDFRIRVTSTSITVEIRKQSDNSLFWSSPTCAMDTLGVPFRQALYSYTYTWVTYHYYENFRMRKYTTTEPSSGAWGSEETLGILLEETISLSAFFSRSWACSELFSLIASIGFPWYQKNLWESLYTFESRLMKPSTFFSELGNLVEVVTPAACQPLQEALGILIDLLQTIKKPLLEARSFLDSRTLSITKVTTQDLQLIESFFIAKLAQILHSLKILLTSHLPVSPVLLDSGGGASLSDSIRRVHPTADPYYSAVGQCFQVPVPYTQVLARLGFLLEKGGNPSGVLVARIYKMTGTFGTDGKPLDSPVDSGILAESDPIDPASLPTSYIGFTYFTFSGANQILLSETYYVIEVVAKSGVFNDTNYVRIYRSSSPVSAGNYSSYSNSTWSAVASWDTRYEVYGYPVGPYYYIKPILFSTGFETGTLRRWSIAYNLTSSDIITYRSHHGSRSLYILWSGGSGKYLEKKLPSLASYYAFKWMLYREYADGESIEIGKITFSDGSYIRVLYDYGSLSLHISWYGYVGTGIACPGASWARYELSWNNSTKTVKIIVNTSQYSVNVGGITRTPDKISIGPTQGQGQAQFFYDCIAVSTELVGIAGEPAPVECEPYESVYFLEFRAIKIIKSVFLEGVNLPGNILTRAIGKFLEEIENRIAVDKEG